MNRQPVNGPCVVVGASLAGLRAAEGLRKGGYSGPLVVLGAEKHAPYNRPPLSKAALSTAGDVELEVFRVPPALADVEWRLGESVRSADLQAQTVTLETGAVQNWSGLIVATGLRSRRLNIPGPRQGPHVLRTFDDAARLRAAVGPGATAVVVGAGFIGCEVAMTLAGLGVDTHIVDPMPLPMERQLGHLLASAVRDRLRAAGINLHLAALPTRYEGEERVTGIRLEDGRLLACDVAVEAVGSVPNVDWLAGNGLDLSDGVLCDRELRVGDRRDVFACGDIARFPHALRRGDTGRIEHWTMAGDTGRRAGRNLALQLAGDEPSFDFAPVPSFWSDLGSSRMQSFGMPGEGLTDVRVLEGDLAGDVAVGYHRGGDLVGVVLFGLGGRYQHYRSRVAETCASATAAIVEAARNG